jgi:hypothetical protein
MGKSKGPSEIRKLKGALLHRKCQVEKFDQKRTSKYAAAFGVDLMAELWPVVYIYII